MTEAYQKKDDLVQLITINSLNWVVLDWRARAHTHRPLSGHMTCKCLSATSTRCTLGNANAKYDETNSQV